MPGTVARIAALALFAWAAPAAGSDDAEGFRLSQTCAGCHGPDGASPGATIPSIGGLDAAYLARALRDYRSGARGFYVMRIVAAGYNDAGIDAIAAWFAARPWRDTPVANDPALAAAGRAAADAMCAGCHGADGRGIGRAPRLAGQPAEYLIAAARAYLTGERADETAAAGLAGAGERDIAATAHFYAGLREADDRSP